MKKAIFILIFFLTVSAAFAQPDTNIFKQKINYVANMDKKAWYNTSVNFSPASMGKVESAFIMLYGDINSETNLDLLVNDKACEPSSYLIAGGTRQERVFFDCTSAIKGMGNYTVSVRFDSQTGTAYFRNLYGEVEIIYTSNPLTLLSAGTEYLPNENGTVFVRILDGNSRPVNLASCNTTIFYPNKTTFLDSEPMTLLGRGVYYKDFELGDTKGVYPVIFDCLFPSAPYRESQVLIVTVSDSFHGQFYFDNSNNLTINSAWFSIATSGLGSVDVYFNTRRIFEGVGAGYYNATLLPSNFILSDVQHYTVDRVWGTPVLINATLYVNYTMNMPQQIIRGQEELHVGIMGEIAKNLSDEIISAVNSSNSSIFWKLYKIQDEIASVNQTQNINFQNVNSSIFGKLEEIQGKILGVNSTLNWLVGYLTNSTSQFFYDVAYAVWNFYSPREVNVVANVTGNVTLSDGVMEKIAEKVYRFFYMWGNPYD